ncbi:MAG: hypothetical protein Q7R76_06825 [Candidatus Woesearchaeota archaeon]|nr:hypothetical protein [Candidatus Woesearchaeota archaeon]
MRTTLHDILIEESAKKALKNRAVARGDFELQLRHIDRAFHRRLPELLTFKLSAKTIAGIDYLVTSGIVRREVADDYKAQLVNFEHDHFGRGGEYYKRGHRIASWVDDGLFTAVVAATTIFCGPLANSVMQATPPGQGHDATLSILAYSLTTALSAAMTHVGFRFVRLGTNAFVHRYETHDALYVEGGFKDDLIHLDRATHDFRDRLTSAALQKPEGGWLRRATSTYSHAVSCLRDAVKELDAFRKKSEYFSAEHTTYVNNRATLVGHIASLGGPASSPSAQRAYTRLRSSS